MWPSWKLIEDSLHRYFVLSFGTEETHTYRNPRMLKSFINCNPLFRINGEQLFYKINSYKTTSTDTYKDKSLVIFLVSCCIWNVVIFIQSENKSTTGQTHIQPGTAQNDLELTKRTNVHWPRLESLRNPLETICTLLFAMFIVEVHNLATKLISKT